MQTCGWCRRCRRKGRNAAYYRHRHPIPKGSKLYQINLSDKICRKV